jgi:hypothetical protein
MVPGTLQLHPSGCIFFAAFQSNVNQVPQNTIIGPAPCGNLAGQAFHSPSGTQTYPEVLLTTNTAKSVWRSPVQRKSSGNLRFANVQQSLEQYHATSLAEQHKQASIQLTPQWASNLKDYHTKCENVAAAADCVIKYLRCPIPE